MMELDLFRMAFPEQFVIDVMIPVSHILLATNIILFAMGINVPQSCGVLNSERERIVQRNQMDVCFPL